MDRPITRWIKIQISRLDRTGVHRDQLEWCKARMDRWTLHQWTWWDRWHQTWWAAIKADGEHLPLNSRTMAMETRILDTIKDGVINHRSHKALRLISGATTTRALNRLRSNMDHTVRILASDIDMKWVRQCFVTLLDMYNSSTGGPATGSGGGAANWSSWGLTNSGSAGSSEYCRFNSSCGKLDSQREKSFVFWNARELFRRHVQPSVGPRIIFGPSRHNAANWSQRRQFEASIGLSVVWRRIWWVKLLICLAFAHTNRIKWIDQTKLSSIRTLSSFGWPHPTQVPIQASTQTSPKCKIYPVQLLTSKIISNSPGNYTNEQQSFGPRSYGGNMGNDLSQQYPPQTSGDEYKRYLNQNIKQII